MRVLAIAGLAVTAWACGPDPYEGQDAAPHPDAMTGGTVYPPDANTCAQSVPIMVDSVGAPPDVLLVVDKSGSMRDNLTGGQQKWPVMRSALVTIIDARRDDVHWGLSLFPMGSQCGAGAVLVGCAPDTHTQITSQLNAVTNPDGATPTHTTLSQVASWYSSHPVN